MKTAFNFCGVVLFGAIAVASSGQTASVPPPTVYSIVHRESNERTWQRTTYSLSASGQAVPHLESYKEVGNGICFSQNGVFLDSNPSISVLADGSGAATNSPCKFYCPADIYNGLIKFVTADGKELDSEPLGLWFSDGANTFQIATLTNSIGELVSSNAVLYPGAFVGGLKGDLLLTFRDSGLEQDAIIRSQPAATPQQLGLSADAKIQLVTEFVNSASPVQNVGPVNPQDGLQDTTLSFGSMRMIQGRAFQIGSAGAQTLQNQTRVYKSWTTTPDGKVLLIEQVPWQRVSAQMSTLPRSAFRPAGSGKSRRRVASSGLHIPPRRSFTAAKTSIKLARADFKEREGQGLDLDYVTIDSAETNFTFFGDTTYLINSSSGFYLDGTTTIEGGSILKFPNGNGSAGLLVIDPNGTINCQTAPFLPGVLTSMNDNSVGSSISGSSGSPSYENSLWCLQINGTNTSVHDLRFCYPWIAIGQNPATGQETTINASDCQFIDGDIAVKAYDANLFNILIGRSTNEDAAVWTDGPNLIGENITADGGISFIEADEAGASVALTNCLVTGQTLLASAGSPVLSTNAVAWVQSPTAPIYETFGGAGYYLTNSSPYRQAGTTNIDPGLLADLATRTTWPPNVYITTNISSLGTLGPVVPRDISSTPDLGYHYNCLDWVFAGCTLSSTLKFTPGTEVGWFEAGDDPNTGQPFGISLNAGANLSFNGNATQPCIFARYPMVQEAENGNWSGDGWLGALAFNGGSPEPQFSANFTKVTSDGWNGNLFRDDAGPGIGAFRNSEFYNFEVSTYNVTSLSFTNCLFFRFNQSYWTSPSLAFENCTFYNGGMYMGRSSAVTWLIENSSFDGTALAWSDIYNGTSYTSISNNAYNTNNLSWQTYPYFNGYTKHGTNEVVGATDLTVTNFNWCSSWFGNFYLTSDSPLIDRGGASASLFGLYEFTTQTNANTIEGNSTVDIGYHYIGSDENGNPYDDGNRDGIPDYLEDLDGNGSLENWNVFGNPGLSALITQPRNGSTQP